MPGPIYVLGAGGHAKVVCDVLASAGSKPEACLIDGEARPTTGPLGLPIQTARPEAEYPADATFLVAIGDNHVRESVARRYSRFATAIHPAATVGREVQIGPGTVVMAGVAINPGTEIGKHCIVNTGSSVDHDCVLEDCCSIAPGAILGGSVRVGHGAAISLGAAVIHGVTIGDHTVVGAGATVLEDLPPSVVAYGVPARTVRSREVGEPYL